MRIWKISWAPIISARGALATGIEAVLYVPKDEWAPDRRRFRPARLPAARSPSPMLQSQPEPRESDDGFRAVLDNMPQGAWATRPDGYYEHYNSQWYEFTGAPANSANGEGWKDFLHPDDQERVLAKWLECVATGARYESEYRLRHFSGKYFWTFGRARPARNNAGEITRWYGTCALIHERVLAQRALEVSEALNRSIIEASPDSIKVLSTTGKVLFVNQAGVKAKGPSDPHTLIGSSWVDHHPPSLKPLARQALASARRGEFGHFTEAEELADGTSRWWDVVVTPVGAEGGRPTRLAVISRDITHQKTAEERLRWTAHHDSLTKLPNRAFFQQYLDGMLDDAAGAVAHFGLLLLDVDDFKRINDTLGHDAGDALLCTFAERLHEAMRPDDIVARLGGDEFAVILTGMENEAQLHTAAQNLLERLRQPCVHGGSVLDCNASIGASIFPEHGTSRAELLKHADIALYAAKASGRGNLKLFHPRMRFEMQKRMSMLALARYALSQDLIVPFYQPKIDFATGRLAGFEALLRWRHPRRGLQKPATILAAFEDAAIAAEISDRMIGKVIADARRWLDAGVDFHHVAINAAAAEFRRGDFAERLLLQLAEARIPPHCIEVEVTETVFLGRGADFVERALKTLSAEGVRIALDDFGTGYASLSHLKQFPVNVIKIDRSFVRGLHDDPDDAAIVEAVINLGKSLGIKIVAEGVETESEAAHLSGKGCDYGQGYLFGKPVPASRVPRLAGRPIAYP